MNKTINFFVLISILGLTGCSAQPTPASLTTVTVDTCPDLMKVAYAFYHSNDASQRDASLSYLTDDVAMVYWAEGANGHHMTQRLVVGKDQMGVNLDQPGLHLKSTGPDLPNYQPDHILQTGKQLTFHLTPDRTHPGGRPYNPYIVELIFSGCRIEIIKIVERVSWL